MPIRVDDKQNHRFLLHLGLSPVSLSPVASRLLAGAYREDTVTELLPGYWVAKDLLFHPHGRATALRTGIGRAGSFCLFSATWIHGYAVLPLPITVTGSSGAYITPTVENYRRRGHMVSQEGPTNCRYTTVEQTMVDLARFSSQHPECLQALRFLGTLDYQQNVLQNLVLRVSHCKGNAHVRQILAKTDLLRPIYPSLGKHAQRH